jgi:hypothetical protein
MVLATVAGANGGPLIVPIKAYLGAMGSGRPIETQDLDIARLDLK